MKSRKITIVGFLLIILAVVLIAIAVFISKNHSSGTEVQQSDIVEDVEPAVEDIEPAPTEEPMEDINTLPSSELAVTEQLQKVLEQKEDVDLSPMYTTQYDAPEEVMDLIPVYAEELKSDLTELGFTQDFEISLDHVDDYDDFWTVYLIASNTDVIKWFQVDKNTGEVMTEFANVIYGSDCTPIYFNNGVPDNSVDIYNAVYEQSTWSVYTTDYVDGNVCVLTDIKTGENIEITLEE